VVVTGARGSKRPAQGAGKRKSRKRGSAALVRLIVTRDVDSVPSASVSEPGERRPTSRGYDSGIHGERVDFSVSLKYGQVPHAGNKGRYRARACATARHIVCRAGAGGVWLNPSRLRGGVITKVFLVSCVQKVRERHKSFGVAKLSDRTIVVSVRTHSNLLNSLHTANFMRPGG